MTKKAHIVVFIFLLSITAWAQCPTFSGISYTVNPVSCYNGNDGSIVFNFTPLTTAGNVFRLFRQPNIPVTSIAASSGPLTFSGLQSAVYDIRYQRPPSCGIPNPVTIPGLSNISMAQPVNPQIDFVLYNDMCLHDYQLVSGTDPIPPRGQSFTKSWISTGPVPVDFIPDNQDQVPLIGPMTMPGIYQVFWSVSISGCTPLTSSGVTFEVHALPTITSALLYTVCSGLPMSYEITYHTTSTINPSFSWSRSAVAGISNGANSDVTSLIGESLVNTTSSPRVTTYTLQVDRNNPLLCNGIPAVLTVTVLPAPQVTATPSVTGICSGQSINVALTSNLPSTSFSWSSPSIAGISGNVAGSGSTISQSLFGSGTAYYYVSATVASGLCPATTNATVTAMVNPQPTITGLFANNVCNNNNALVTFTGSPASSVNYSWTTSLSGSLSATPASGTGSVVFPALANISSMLMHSDMVTQNAIFSITPTIAGTGCVGNTYSYSVQVYPTVIITTASAISTCSGTPFTYNIGTNIPASSFTWQRPNVAGITQPGTTVTTSFPIINNTLTNTTTSNIIVNYTITATNVNSCPGIPFVLAVTVHPLPTFAGLSGISTCSGAPFSISLNSIPVATNHTWQRLANPFVAGTNSASGVNTINDNIISTTTTANAITYSITPFNSLGCPGPITTTSIIINPRPTVTGMFSQSPICSRNSTNISFTGISTSTGVITYAWNANVSGMQASATAGTGNTIFVNLTNTGISTLTSYFFITPNIISTGCVGNVVTITADVRPEPIVSSSLIQSVCESTPFVYNITSNISVSGFMWARNSVPGILNTSLSGSTTTINETFTGSGIVMYIITPVGFGGCPSMPSVLTVTVNPLPIISISGNNYICIGASTTLSVSGTATSYLWQPGVATGNPQSFSPVSNTIFTLTGSTLGCSRSATYSVTVNSLPVVSISGNNPICAASVASLTASGANTYLWNTGATTHIITVNPVSTTAYSVSGTNTTTGCVNNASFTVNVNPLPTVSANSNSPVCVGQTLTLAGTGAVSYTYAGNNLLANTGATVSATPTISGIYTITGTDVNGCRNTGTVAATVNTLPAVNITGASTVCSGLSVNLTANGAVSYNWMPGNLSGAVQTLSPASTTTYTITGVNGASCSAAALFTITVISNPTVAISVPAPICAGNIAALTATGNGLSHIWSGPSLSATTGSIVITSTTSTNTFNVTALGINGCINTASNTLTVNPLPTVSANSNSPVCVGQTLTLAGTGAVSYTYAGNNLLANTGATVSATPTISGIYTITGTDVNGCRNTGTVAATVNTLPAVNITGASTVCSGLSVNLTANGAVSYNWMPGNLSGAVQTLSPASTTTYTITGVNGASCSSSTMFTMTVISNPTLTITGATNICEAINTALTASGANTYAWMPGALSGNVVNVNPSTATIYTITGTNTVGCVSSINYTLNVTPNVSAPNAPSGITARCAGAGSSAYNTSSTPASVNATLIGWSMSTGAAGSISPMTGTGTLLTFNSTFTGNIIMSVTGYGCGTPQSSILNIMVNTTPTVGVIGFAHPSGCGTSDGSISISGVGTSLNYSIDNGANFFVSNIFSSLGVSSNTLMVRDVNNCLSNNNITINLTAPGIPAAPVVSGGGTYCLGNIINTITITGSGNQIQVSTSAGFTTIINTLSGSFNNYMPNTATGFTYYFREILGTCAGISANATVVINPNPTVNVMGTNTICFGNNTVLTASGAASINWMPGNLSGNIQSLSPSSATTYTITGNTSGCTDVETFTINVVPTVTISAISGIMNRCQSSGTNSFTVNTDGSITGWNITSGSGSINSSGLATWNSSFTGIATVEVTVSGCGIATSLLTVTVNSTPIISNIIKSDASSCSIDDGIITIAGTGIDMEFSLDGSTFTSSEIFSGLAIGAYTPYVRNMNAPTCSVAGATTNINAPLQPVAPSISGSFTGCEGGIVPLVTVTSTATGYLALYLNSTEVANVTGSLLIYDPGTVSGSYFFNADINVSGCTSPTSNTATYIINTIPPAASVPVTEFRYCHNATTAGMVSPSGLEFNWYDNSVGGNNLGNVMIPPTTAVGIFMYYVSETVNGCESTDRGMITVTITNITFPGCSCVGATALFESPAPEPPTCHLSTTTYSITFSGVAPYSISYYQDYGTGSMYTTITGITDTEYLITFTGRNDAATPGHYNFVTILGMTDTYCVGSILPSDNWTLAFPVNPLPTMQITAPAPVCSPNTVDISDNGLYTLTGGNQFAFYPTFADALNFTNEISQPVVVSDATPRFVRYHLSFTPQCYVISTVSAVINTAPSATLSASATPICVGDSKLLNIDFTAIAPYTVSGIGLATTVTSSNPYTFNVFPTTTTSYSLTSIINQCGAGTVSGTVMVNVLPSGSIFCNSSLTGHLTNLGGGSICSGGSSLFNLVASVTGWTGPATLVIGNDIGQPELTISGTVDGLGFVNLPISVSTTTTFTLNYLYGGTMAGLGTGSKTIVVNPSPVLSVTSPLIATCGQTLLNITTSFTDLNNAPTQSINYWTDAAKTITLASPNMVTTSGVFYIEKITPAGCSSTSPIQTIFREIPTAQILGGGAICPGQNASIFVNISGAASPFALSMHDGTTTSAITVSGSYSFNSSIVGATYTLVSITGAYCAGSVSGVATVMASTTCGTATCAANGFLTPNTTALCAAGTVNVNFNLLGTSPYNVVYSDGVATYTMSGINASSTMVGFNIISNTTITLINVQDNTGCVATVGGAFAQSVITIGGAGTLTGIFIPVATSATEVGCTQFTANFNTVSGAYMYELEVLTSGGVIMSLLTSLGNNLTVSGLSNYTEYMYRVRGYYTCGVSEYSSIINITTNGIPAMPVTSSISSSPSGTAIITWGNVNGTLSYEIGMSQDIAMSTLVSGFPTTTTSTSLTVTGLAQSNVYYYTLVGINACGISSTTIAGFNVPQVPALTITGGGLICIGAPANILLNYSGALPYTLTYNKNGNGISQIFNALLDTLSENLSVNTAYEFTSLTDGTGYTITLAGIVNITTSSNLTATNVLTPSFTTGCSSATLLLTLSGSNTGINPILSIYRNGIEVQTHAGLGVVTYAGDTLLTGDQIYTILTVSGEATCVTNSPVMSNVLTVTIKDFTASVIGGRTSCLGGSDGTLTAVVTNNVNEDNRGRTFEFSLNNNATFNNSGDFYAYTFTGLKDTSYYLISIRDKDRVECIVNLTYTGGLGVKDFIPEFTTQDPSCNGNDGGIAFQATSSSVLPPYLFTISGVNVVDTKFSTIITTGTGAVTTFGGLSRGVYSIYLGYTAGSNVCVYQRSYTIEGTTSPAVNLGKDTTICAGTTMVLSAPGVAAGAYTWLQNDTIISNFVTAVVQVRPTQKTKYTVIVPIDENCKAQGSVFIDVSSIKMKSVSTQFDNESNVEVKWTMVNRDKFPDGNLSVFRNKQKEFGVWAQLTDVSKADTVFISTPELPQEDILGYYVSGNVNKNCRSDAHYTIKARLDNIDEEKATIKLSWNAYKGWPQGVKEYQVWRKIDAETQYTLLESELSQPFSTTDTTITIDNIVDGFDHYYRIKAIAQGNDSLYSWSSSINTQFQREIEPVNAFSPNGDGVNDYYYIKNIEAYPNCEVFIFNRWGGKVYYAKPYKNDWNGGGQPDGTYFVIINLNKGNAAPYKKHVLIQK